LLILGLVCQLIGWITINHAIRYLDSTQVSIALLGQTIMTAMLAAIILHEQVGFETVTGGTLVLLGIGVTFVKRKAIK
jgi:drug/metabolite transporter (DMT)-like permease